MAEISREKAIKWLEKAAPVCACKSSEFVEFIEAVNKAISDMEKLHKIEEVINGTFANETMKILRIEQILKEVE